MLEGVTHTMLSLNGIDMHVAEKGTGPPVLLLHGFPEFWYAWRFQIPALAALGFRAIAPDLRGYGNTTTTDAGTGTGTALPARFTSLHVVGDLVALIDSLGTGPVYLVGHDWGANIGWYLSTYRPDRVKAFVALAIPYRPRNPASPPLPILRKAFGDNYYICRFQKPGEIEADIARFGAAAVLRKLLTTRNPEPPILQAGNNPFGIDLNKPDPLPAWLSEEDLQYYAQTYNRTGFTGGLNYYRALDLNWELTAPWTGAKVKVPVKFVVGDLDSMYNTLEIKDYINNGGMKKDVPLLDDVVVMQGVGHYIHQEKANEINTIIAHFMRKF